MPKENKNCGCIFCSSKCPECGSIFIDVTFKAKFNYHNNTKNEIRLYSEIGEIELSCQECGETFESNDYEQDDRLDNLLNEIESALKLPDELVTDINDKGEISFKPSNYLTSD